MLWTGEAYDSETARAARGWAAYEREGSTIAHMRRHLRPVEAAPFTIWTALKATLLFLPCGLLALAAVVGAVRLIVLAVETWR
jgi:hypothetical protein